MDENNSRKKEIEDLGLEAIKNYFDVDVSDIDEKIAKHLHQKARLGMQFEREMCIDKRAVEMNYIRVFKLIAGDKDELKKYIEKSMPQYVPTLD